MLEKQKESFVYIKVYRKKIMIYKMKWGWLNLS